MPKYAVGERVTLDMLAVVCGFFDPDSPGYNGYGCNHQDAMKVNGYGVCSYHACPFAANMQEPDDPDYDEDMVEIHTPLPEEGER